MADGQIFNTITHGFNTMMAYGDKVTVKDRWAIIAYIRALQKSQNARLEDVPEDQRAALENEGKTAECASAAQPLRRNQQKRETNANAIGAMSHDHLTVPRPEIFESRNVNRVLLALLGIGVVLPLGHAHHRFRRACRQRVAEAIRVLVALCLPLFLHHSDWLLFLDHCSPRDRFGLGNCCPAPDGKSGNSVALDGACFFFRSFSSAAISGIGSRRRRAR